MCPPDTVRPLAATPTTSGATATPVLIEVTRGTMIESRHRGSAVVIDPDGRVVRTWGNVETPAYPRSSIKPIQALPLVESGAADAFGLGDVELALACASHQGEPRHVAAVTAWLARIGRAPDDLECGPQVPSGEDAARALFAARQAPAALHNNCSGKHTGMLSTAVHLGVPTKGYTEPAHPVQQRILGVFETMCGLDLGDAPRGVDGCSAPVYAMPLGNLALGMARFADPTDQPEARRHAAARLRRAMAAEPFMVHGTGTFVTECMQAMGEAVLVKGGAEGMFTAALPGPGLGVALKIDDGAARASEVAMANILRALGVFSDAATATLAEWLTRPLRNWAGSAVGEIRPAPALGGVSAHGH
jgi:L-asparaginase II